MNSQNEKLEKQKSSSNEENLIPSKLSETIYLNQDNKNIQDWFNQNYTLDGQKISHDEDPIVLTNEEKEQIQTYFKDEAFARGEEYINPFNPIETNTKNEFNFESGSIGDWLVNQYSLETNPIIKQTLLEKIQLVSRENINTPAPDNAPIDPEPPTNNTATASSIPNIIDLPHLTDSGLIGLINQYNEETDPQKKQNLFYRINLIRPIEDTQTPDEEKETIASGTNIEFYVDNFAGDPIVIDNVNYPSKFKTLNTFDDALNDWIKDYNSLPPEQTEERKNLFKNIKNRWDNYSVSNLNESVKPDEVNIGIDELLLNNPNFDPKIIQLIDDQQIWDEENFPDFNHDLAVKLNIEYRNLRNTGDQEHYTNILKILQQGRGSSTEEFTFFYNEELPRINPNLSLTDRQQVAELMKQFMEEDHDYSKRTVLFDKINKINNKSPEIPPSRPIIHTNIPVAPEVPPSRPIVVPEDTATQSPISQSEIPISSIEKQPSRPAVPPNAGVPEIPEAPVFNPDHLEPPPPSVPIVSPEEKAQKQEQKRFALLSQASYNSYYEDPETANAKLQNYLPAHTILAKDTTKNSTVIQKINNEGEQEIIISFRGTDPTNPLDLLADAQILSGNPLARLNHPTGRFKEAEDTYLRIKAKYPKAKIMLTGHSLGGRQALLLGEKYDVPTEVFNIGSSPLDLLFPNAPKRDNIKIYNVGADIISMTGSLNTNQTVIETPNRGYAPNPTTAHSLDNFIPNWILSGRPNRNISNTTDAFGSTTDAFKQNEEPTFKTATASPWVRSINPEPFESPYLQFVKSVSSGLPSELIQNEFIAELLENEENPNPNHKDCYIDKITGKKVCPHEHKLVKPRANYYA